MTVENMACNETCPYEGQRCDGADGHGALVGGLVHFHTGDGPHTWNSKTRELLRFDGRPLYAPSRESELLKELKRDWKSEEVEIPVASDEAVEDALKAYMDRREAQGKTGSFKFRFTKITTKADGETVVEELEVN